MQAETKMRANLRATVIDSASVSRVLGLPFRQTRNFIVEFNMAIIGTNRNTRVEMTSARKIEKKRKNVCRAWLIFFSLSDSLFTFRFSFHFNPETL